MSARVGDLERPASVVKLDPLAEPEPGNPSAQGVRDVGAKITALLDGEDAPMPKLRIIFDGPPGHESGRFIETEDLEGHGRQLGERLRQAAGTRELPVARLHQRSGGRQSRKSSADQARARPRTARHHQLRSILQRVQ